tara:strand:- start:209 stop:838 length:630 start_codon:yes stop_codon:yes gene_type:complete
MLALIKAGADVNIQNKAGETSLMVMCGDNKSVKCVKLLIKHGAHVNIQDKCGDTALIKASLDNSVYMRSDYEVRHNIKPMTKKCVKCMKTLLNAGADPNIQNNNGNTALIRASCYTSGQPEIIKCLIKANTNLNIQNKYGNTALMVAAKNGYIGYVKLLLQKNANMGITNCNEETCLELLCDCDHIWDMEKKKNCIQIRNKLIKYEESR